MLTLCPLSQRLNDYAGTMSALSTLCQRSRSYAYTADTHLREIKKNRETFLVCSLRAHIDYLDKMVENPVTLSIYLNR